MDISIIIPSCNEGPWLAWTLFYIEQNPPTGDFEVIVIDDGSDDGSIYVANQLLGSKIPLIIVKGSGLGAGGARNLGVERSTGENLIFLDAHTMVHPGALDALREPLLDVLVGMTGPVIAPIGYKNGTTGAGGTIKDGTFNLQWHPAPADHQTQPYAVLVAPVGAVALRTEVFNQVRGFDKGMSRWGGLDVDMSMLVWLMGYSVMVAPTARIGHRFSKTFGYVVNGSEVLYNKLRSAVKHLDLDRAGRIMDYEAMHHCTVCDSGPGNCAWKGRQNPYYSKAIRLLMESDVLAERDALLKSRVHDDEWLLDRFGVII